MTREQKASELHIGTRVMRDGIEKVVGSIRWQGVPGLLSIQFVDTRSRVTYDPADVVIVVDEAA